MIKENDIRMQLAALVDRRLSLDAFEDWLVASSWNMHKDSSRDAIELALSVELLLSEYSSGHRSEADLFREFSDLVKNQVVSLQIRVVSVGIEVMPGRLGFFGSNAYQPR